LFLVLVASEKSANLNDRDFFGGTVSTLKFEDRLRSLRTRSVITQVALWLFLLIASMVAIFTAMMTYTGFADGYSRFMVDGPAMAFFLMIGAIPVLISFCA